jgi:DNA replication protein DnaC
MSKETRIKISETEDFISWRDKDEFGMEYDYSTPTLAHNLKSAGIPKSCWGAKPDFNNTICKKLKTLKEGQQIVLSGTYGCGKTWGVFAWAIEQIKTGKDIICKDANSFYMELKTDEGREEFDKYKKLPCLIIDDLGVEYDAQSGYFQSLLDDLINVRYVNNLTTIITTNLTMEKFGQRYGGRIIDRLRDSGGYFESKDKSFRGKKQ